MDAYLKNQFDLTNGMESCFAFDAVEINNWLANRRRENI